MKHQAMELNKVCINHDPWMTLTYFTARSTYVAHACKWGKLLQCHLKCKTCSKLANGLNLYDLKKKLTPEVALTLPRGYIHVYYHSSYKQVYWYISQVSGERLQDHWSSGYTYFLIIPHISLQDHWYSSTSYKYNPQIYQSSR